jgi:hypothetical protein
MSFKEKGYFAKAALLLAAGYFLTFIVYYLANYVIAADGFSYFYLFFRKITYLLLPALSAVAVLCAAPFKDRASLFLASTSLALARITFSIPNFYLLLVAEHYSSIEALALGSLLAILESLITYVIIILIYALMQLIIRLANKNGADLKALVIKTTKLDFGDPIAAAIATVSAACFIYYFIAEIIQTVGFFTDYSSTMNAEEIIYTVASYIIDILVLPSYFFSLCFAKNFIMSKRACVRE